MSPLALHALRRHGPNLRIKVDLIPLCAEHLAVRAAVRSGEFERPSRDTLTLAEFDHEIRQFGLRQGGMVLDLLHLATGRKRLIEMAAPAGRVFALAVPRLLPNSRSLRCALAPVMPFPALWPLHLRPRHLTEWCAK